MMIDAMKPEIPPGYMMDGRGNLVAEKNVRAVDRLEDQLVKGMVGHADALNGQIARFLQHCHDDVDAFNRLVGEKYGAKPRGGSKGGMTFTSFDGRLRVRFVAAEIIEFGPSILAAKALIEECIAEWSAGANPGIIALVQRAFEVDRAGNLSLAKIRALRQVEQEDDRWVRAMAAIDDAERPLSKKVYPQFHRRESPDHSWQLIPINLATAAISTITEGGEA